MSALVSNPISRLLLQCRRHVIHRICVRWDKFSNILYAEHEYKIILKMRPCPQNQIISQTDYIHVKLKTEIYLGNMGTSFLIKFQPLWFPKPNQRPVLTKQRSVLSSMCVSVTVQWLFCFGKTDICVVGRCWQFSRSGLRMCWSFHNLKGKRFCCLNLIATTFLDFLHSPSAY